MTVIVAGLEVELAGGESNTDPMLHVVVGEEDTTGDEETTTTEVEVEVEITGDEDVGTTVVVTVSTAGIKHCPLVVCTPLENAVLPVDVTVSVAVQGVQATATDDEAIFEAAKRTYLWIEETYEMICEAQVAVSYAARKLVPV